MKTTGVLVVAVAAAATAAGCGTQGGASTSRAGASSAAAGSYRSAAGTGTGGAGTGGTGTGGTGHGRSPRNVTVAAGAAHLPPGPFRIVGRYCGVFTAAQRARYGTTARGGLVYTYTDTSATVTGAPNLSAEFLRDGTVAGSGFPATLTSVRPGHSATGEVDAVDAGGRPLAFTGCELVSYTVVTGAGGGPPGSYAP